MYSEELVRSALINNDVSIKEFVQRMGWSNFPQFTKFAKGNPTEISGNAKIRLKTLIFPFYCAIFKKTVLCPCRIKLNTVYLQLKLIATL